MTVDELLEEADDWIPGYGSGRAGTLIYKLAAALRAEREVREALAESEKPAVGTPGVRDLDFPCSEYEPGEPGGRCESDGHLPLRGWGVNISGRSSWGTAFMTLVDLGIIFVGLIGALALVAMILTAIGFVMGVSPVVSPGMSPAW